MPVTNETPIVNASTVQSRPISRERGIAFGLTYRIRSIPQRASTNPMVPPINDSSTLSVSNCRAMRHRLAPTAVHFTDITAESGLPDLHGPASAIALGDIDGDGEDNLLIAWSEQGHPVARLFALHGGFVNDLSARTPVPLPAGATFATFADYDNDGWLDLFAIGTDGRGYLLRNSAGQKFEDVTKAAGMSDVNGATRGLFVDLDHDGDLDLLLVGDHSLTALRNNLDGSFTRFPDNGLAGAATDAV